MSGYRPADFARAGLRRYDEHLTRQPDVFPAKAGNQEKNAWIQARRYDKHLPRQPDVFPAKAGNQEKNK
jgi:hypothetical protein